MSEWITDRVPTSADADERGYVWVCWKDGSVMPDSHDKISKGTAWHPKPKKPAPYQPPKPPRAERWFNTQTGRIFTSDPGKAFAIHVREVLPTDPTPEAVEEVVEQLDRVCEEAIPISVRTWLQELAEMLRGKQ